MQEKAQEKKLTDMIGNIKGLKEVYLFGSYASNKMRQERNINLYGGRFVVGAKDSFEYLKFVKNTFKKAGI